MQAGDLRHQITLLRKTATKNARGGEVIAYESAAVVPAAASPIQGREYQMMGMAGSDVEIRFTIYYRSDVRTDWRVKWRDVEYEIVSPPIDVKAQKQWLELMAKTAPA
jgi:SPP1 family predicted phage head-tail adaptor